MRKYRNGCWKTFAWWLALSVLKKIKWAFQFQVVFQKMTSEDADAFENGFNWVDFPKFNDPFFNDKARKFLENLGSPIWSFRGPTEVAIKQTFFTINICTHFMASHPSSHQKSYQLPFSLTLYPKTQRGTHFGKILKKN